MSDRFSIEEKDYIKKEIQKIIQDEIEIKELKEYLKKIERLINEQSITNKVTENGK